MSNVEKMQQLKIHIIGEAQQLIQHLHINDSNYQTAWGILNGRYSNKRLLLSQLINSIIEQPKCRAESPNQLRKLHDTTKECLQAISNLGFDITSWGPFIGHMVTRLWDDDTNTLYEQSLENPKEVQELDDILKFLERRFYALAGRSRNQVEEPERNYPTCEMCNHNHFISKCHQFLSLNSSARCNLIKDKHLCNQCLKRHGGKCQAQFGCKHCNRNHHTLLHINSYKSHQGNGKRSHNAQCNLNDPLLATAIVHITTIHGDNYSARALIDQGSQVSLITENAVQRIGLKKQSIRGEITGIGSAKTELSKSKVMAYLCPNFKNTWHLTTELMVLPKITSTLSTGCDGVDYEVAKYWENRQLADPHFYVPGEIDILLGASDVANILLEGLEKHEGFMAQNSELGWLISGGQTFSQNSSRITLKSCMQTFNENMSRFWELEETPSTSTTMEEAICEEIYMKTTSRGKDGRYTVSLPLKETPPVLGESKTKATARFLQMEKRLSQNRELRAEYNKFMHDYINLGHMKLSKNYHDNHYYIPHHAVMKTSSSTTKLRVVFDASCQTSVNTSLNDQMYIGTQLQNDITEIILRWRAHKIVFSADIEKMYRQILIAQNQQCYQKILWRFHPQAMIKEYCLKTVTYGVAAAPYLAIRTLHQLATDEEMEYPQISNIIRKDFYVDDVLSGANNIDDAIQLQKGLLTVMNRGGFNLRKWASNDPRLLDNLPEEMVEQSKHELNIEESIKTLGIIWDPHLDSFAFKINIKTLQKITKRSILSEISKLFDPLGWFAPVTITAKLLVQQLWIENFHWDQSLPKNHIKKWCKFYDELPAIEDVRISRWMFTTNNHMELHGFCDASEKAYGAVVYSKSTYHGKLYITLLQAKSKVAPIKTKTTLPRLELCAAQLLAKLLDKLKKLFTVDDDLIHAWTDSMITLCWIKAPNNKWETFVANRVLEINRYLPGSKWKHVRTHENPADYITRGILPRKMKSTNLWWNGPMWLKQEASNWPAQPPIKTPSLIKCLMTVAIKRDMSIIERFSELHKMLRILTYCRRFKTKMEGSITFKEKEETLEKLITIIQQVEFQEEIKALTAGISIGKNSPIRSLSPFIDHNGILSVGGRLDNANLCYRQRHPILLPLASHLSRLIIANAHNTTLHGGIESTLAFVRRKYWIPKAKESIRATIRNCIKCIRYKATTEEQYMGQLPRPRVTPSRPFTHTGVDYAGPINIRTSKGRGNKSTKGYIAIFICLATKAIHIEVASDLTACTFLAAFRRFIGRRGPCSDIYSDNGSNFVGAAKQLRLEVKHVEESAEVRNCLSKIGTNWHFIPAVSPHFGGLWEAGVKSIKHHLRRQIADTTLTYEELDTLLCQIEAVLNSRPLYSQHNDHDEIDVITPGHFLVGSALIEPPNLVATPISASLAERWQLILKMKRDFWKSWSGEYLARLQHRYKWNHSAENIQRGQVVIIKEKDINPARWPLAKIEETHPGNDQRVRVVTLRNAQGKTFKRAIVNLIPLPS